MRKTLWRGLLVLALVLPALAWGQAPGSLHRRPANNQELTAYLHAYMDSVKWAGELRQTQQAARAVGIMSRLLETKAAGPLTPPRPVGRPTPYESTDGFSQYPMHARRERSLAYEAMGDYARAVADLDTLILYYPGSDYWQCRRGLLLAEHLHDLARACPDLDECQRRWHQPVPRRWRDCADPLFANSISTSPGYAKSAIHARAVRQGLASYKMTGREGIRAALFGHLEATSARLGYFHQGSVSGGELGLQWSEAGEGGINYGPSVGVEVGGYNGPNGATVLVAPKLSYEAQVLLVGGRLDLAYYLADIGPRVVGDLRLTPQIGLSLLAVLNVYYGYALPVLGPEIGPLGRHRLSIYINLLDISGFNGKIGG